MFRITRIVEHISGVHKCINTYHWRVTVQSLVLHIRAQQSLQNLTIQLEHRAESQSKLVDQAVQRAIYCVELFQHCSQFDMMESVDSGVWYFLINTHTPNSCRNPASKVAAKLSKASDTSEPARFSVTVVPLL